MSRITSEVGSTFGKGPVQTQHRFQSRRFKRRSDRVLSPPRSSLSRALKTFKFTSFPSSLGNCPAKREYSNSKYEALRPGTTKRTIEPAASHVEFYKVRESVPLRWDPARELVTNAKPATDVEKLKRSGEHLGPRPCANHRFQSRRVNRSDRVLRVLSGPVNLFSDTSR